MSEQIAAWIRRVAALNDAELEEESRLINKNSLNAFTRAISRTRRPELDFDIHRNGAYEAHPHADTMNLLLSIGANTLSAINSETPVSPVPYAQSPYGCHCQNQGLDQTNHYIHVRATTEKSF
jgi:hypothetical protein